MSGPSIQSAEANTRRGVVEFYMEIVLPCEINDWESIFAEHGRNHMLSTETVVGDGTPCGARFQLQVVPVYRNDGSLKLSKNCVQFWIYLKLVSCDKETIHVNYSFHLYVPDRHGSGTYKCSSCFDVGNRHGMRLRGLRINQGLQCSGRYYYEKVFTEDSILVKDMTFLLNKHYHSDVMLMAGSVSLPAHRVILAARSPVFKAMFEHQYKENETGIVDVKDVDDDVLMEMLRYVYTGKWPERMDDMAEQLLVVANKYGLEELKAMCERHFCNCMTVDNVVSILILADTHAAQNLRDTALTFICECNGDVRKTKEWRDLYFSHASLAFEMTNVIISKLEKHTTYLRNKLGMMD